MAEPQVPVKVISFYLSFAEYPRLRSPRKRRLNLRWMMRVRAHSFSRLCQVFSYEMVLRILKKTLTTADLANPTYMVYVQLPHGDKIELPMGGTDTMMEVRQFLSDAPQSCCTNAVSSSPLTRK